MASLATFKWHQWRPPLAIRCTNCAFRVHRKWCQWCHVQFDLKPLPNHVKESWSPDILSPKFKARSDQNSNPNIIHNLRVEPGGALGARAPPPHWKLGLGTPFWRPLHKYQQQVSTTSINNTSINNKYQQPMEIYIYFLSIYKYTLFVWRFVWCSESQIIIARDRAL